MNVNDWVINAVEQGHSPETLIVHLRAAGWEEEQALQAIESALKGRLSKILSAKGTAEKVTAALLPPAVAVPEPDVSDGRSAINVDGHELGIRFMMTDPRVIVFEGFLTLAECDELITQSQDRLEVSRVVGNALGENDLHPARVSRGMFFARGESPLIVAIEQRIAHIIRWPVDRGEAIQILHYGLGGKYDPHYDYFRLDMPATAETTKLAGNRVATLIMYLNTPTRGGGTLFPDVGLELKARKGDAVFFSYDKPDPSTKTLHGGMPVLEGEKWIATKWLRERKF